VSTKGDLETNASKARQTLAEHHAATEQANDGQTMVPKKEVWDADDTAEADRVDDQFGSAEAITQHLSEPEILALIQTTSADRIR
jgi:hypothetical protein